MTISTAFAWIANDSPRAASAMITRIRARLDLLASTRFAELGRLGRVRGTRELIDGPFIIVHEDRENGREMRWPRHGATYPIPTHSASAGL